MIRTISQEFVEHQCPNCAVYYFIPKRLHDSRKESGESFYCPNGHGAHYAESEADKYRRENERLKQEQARLIAERDEEAQARRSAEAEAQRLTKRAVAAVCPCCHRSFANVARHMKTKHPDVVALQARRPA